MSSPTDERPFDSPDIEENDRPAEVTAPVRLPQQDTRETALWAIFADISQGLQVSSASVKAAISSLLDTSIIWGRSAQYEFMQNIDKSIDHVSALMAIMTLAMKAESGRLELAPEPSSIQEIITRVTDSLGKEQPDASFQLVLSDAVKPAYVDYDYLRIALKILLEALISAGRKAPTLIAVRAEETSTDWRIEIAGDFTGATLDLIAWLRAPLATPLPASRRIQSEVILKAFTAYRLLELQRIHLLSSPEDASGPAITLIIPHSGETWTSAAYS